MKYFLFKVAKAKSDSKRNRLTKMVQSSVICVLESLPIPQANPYWKNRYEAAENWWIEADAEGLPIREIGFTVDNRPIVIGPLSRNMGFIIDSNVTFEQFQNDESIEREFERVWNEVKQEMLAENPLPP